MDRRLEAEEAVDRLREVIGTGYHALGFNERWGDPAFVGWKHGAERVIARIYGESSYNLAEFRAILDRRPAPTVFPEEGESFYSRSVRQALAMLESMVAEADKEVAVRARPQESNAPVRRVTESNVTNRIFVVHGRDPGPKANVARFLEQLRLEPVILHEQSDCGRTIIEKIEQNSAVGFAVILLTGDDEGRLAGSSGAEKRRARQNVIFEFGYFIGRIGRPRVCALLEEGVERPSDIDGFVYVPLDSEGAWKIRLLKELKAAGYSVDANKAL